MDKILPILFIAGWFDPLDKRLAYMTAYDRALNSERKTTRVRTMPDDCWGML